MRAGCNPLQIESYLELHETHATVGLPTVQPLRRDEVPYEQALHALVSSHTVEQEEAARIALVRVSRAGQPRPLLYSWNRAHDGFLLLSRETDNRYFEKEAERRVGVRRLLTPSANRQPAEAS